MGWFLVGSGVVSGGYWWLGLVISDGWLSVVMGGYPWLLVVKSVFIDDGVVMGS